MNFFYSYKAPSSHLVVLFGCSFPLVFFFRCFSNRHPSARRLLHQSPSHSWWFHTDIRSPLTQSRSSNFPFLLLSRHRFFTPIQLFLVYSITKLAHVGFKSEFGMEKEVNKNKVRKLARKITLFLAG